MGKKRIKDEKIERFLVRLRKKFRVEKVVLFGSRARGEALKDSDYDFIIVSPDFEGIFFTRRIAMIYDLWKGKEKIEAFCYTPGEFERKKKEIGIVREALREGIELL